MLRTLKTWDDVFEAAGGPAEVARAIGTGTEHAAAMKRRKRIPSRYWADLVRDCQARGILTITYELLALIDAGIAPQHQKAPARVA